ncbi:hypothetical protein BgiMline_033529 [Biomphalaria glabrata]|uniref:Lupus La protein homolog n=1 Tax=Biomphalaria glabrata TaxID=6526 RepID=A0A9W2Z5S4_BIOGL|nr:lupus La protein homolog [Biomphalaria glabrata]KAI8738891.1 lupus La protein; partial [Biomphalaria glabrata]
MSTQTSNGEDEQIKKINEKVVKQIEYYFGDMNLMRDKFLKEKIQEDDGWVTIETMLKFNRLKQITDDSKVICEALKSSSELVEVSENGDKIRRRSDKPLPGDTQERRDEINNRSIYAKGFPLDAKLDDLMSFFETYGPTENVFMKKEFHKKTFKGSVFVVFKNKEDAAKFISEEETKYQDSVLEVKKFKADYFKDKQAARKSKGNKKEDKSKPQEAEKNTEEEESEKARQQMTRNAVLFLKGMDPETSREEIKTFFAPHGDVGWVDFDKGSTEGYLRLKEANSAEPTLEKARKAGDGKIVIHDKELEVRVVEGDEELEYWKKMFREIAERHDKKKKGGRGGPGRGGKNQRGGKRGRGGYQGKRRQNRRRDDGDGDSGAEDNDDDDEPKCKTVKTDSD